eukprot:Tbor_TRINITY_DN882_c0_g1::TRINITY_DN882_c0_g1_i1::g.26678::m.26678
MKSTQSPESHDVNPTIARIRYLEQLCEQLAQQNTSSKLFASNEVDDLRQVMAQQIGEVKQIVIFQERVYQERIRRLETRVEQLSEFCLQLARSTNFTGQLNNVPLDSIISPLVTHPSNDGETDETLAPNLEFADDEMEPGPQGVLTKYERKIDSIYLHYTASASQVSRPNMTMTHFFKFANECNLSGFAQAEPAELLWMAVIRMLQQSRIKKHKRQHRENRKIIIYHLDKDKAFKDTFAFERLDEITREEFPVALFHLAMIKLGRWQPEAKQESTLETFLLRDIFPKTDRALESGLHRLGPIAATMKDPSLGGAQAAMEYKFNIEEYRTSEGVRKSIKEHISRLKDGFLSATKVNQAVKDWDFMTIESFVEFIRRHDLMPSITKTDLRYIFMTVAQMERGSNSENFADRKEDCITVASLPRLIYHLADRIYGDPLFVSSFPTPEARVDKLLAKMFLLKR